MKTLIAALLAMSATPAFAHHPLGGLPMATFADGLLSGLGHPILGFDHLFFVAAVGVGAMLAGARWTAPLAYIAAMLAGCVLMAAGIGLPLKEAVIAVSLLALGGAVLAGRPLGPVPVAALVALFGLFHGSAFGDALAGQEGGAPAAIFAGYLVGLGVVQYLIAVGVAAGLRAVWRAAERRVAAARLVGAAVAGAGLFLTLEVVEGPLLALAFGA